MNLKYSVEIMRDHGEMEAAATASEIPESFLCSYSANFKLMVIRCKEEPTTTRQHGNPVLHNRVCDAGKKKRKKYHTVLLTQNLMKSIGVCARKIEICPSCYRREYFFFN